MAEPRVPFLFIRCHYVSYWIIGFFPDDGRNSLTKSQWSWLPRDGDGAVSGDHHGMGFAVV